MADGFGLSLQRMQRAKDRVLVVGHVIGLRNQDGSFTPQEIMDFFSAVRVPPPNVRASISRLADEQLTLRTGPGRWSMTPKGDYEAGQIASALDLAGVAAELVGRPGAEVAHERHPMIAPALAPPRFQPGIQRILDRFPLERNVFCMTRFPVSEDDPVHHAIATITSALASHGLQLHLASHRQAEDDLLGNVAAHMWACQYGIGILEDRVGRGLNYNVMIELGSMIVTGRRCAVLRDVGAPELPTDFAGHIYKPTDLTDHAALTSVVTDWVVDDLGL